MLRFIMPLLIVLSAPLLAFADPSIPEIESQARHYHESLESKSTDIKLDALLSGIRRSQNSGSIGQTITQYEQLVALNQNNFRAWLKLGLAWREADKGSASGVNAAWNAYNVAQSVPDKIEASLLISSILREQLRVARDAYQANHQAFSDLTQEVAGEGDCENSNESAGATGRLKLACRTRDKYSTDMRRAAARVGEIAHDLDEIYTDISSKLPELDVRKMQASDSRSLVFAPISTKVHDLGSDEDKDHYDISYKLRGQTWRGCIEFTQELGSDGGAYNNFTDVTISSDEENTRDPTEEENAGDPNLSSLKQTAPEKFQAALSTQGHFLCIDNLPPGKNFNLALKKGMRSKLGLELETDISDIPIGGPNLPAEIHFSGGGFVLPRSGSGKIEVRAVNLDRFQGELFRVTDRTLYRQIALGYLGGADDHLPADEYKGLRKSFGELLWRGRVSMPGHSKPNEANKALFPARALLNRRSEWIQEQLANRNISPSEVLSSGDRHDFIGDQSQTDLSGEYYADSSDFEASARAVGNPGVYALVTPKPGENCEVGVGSEDQTCDRLVQWFVDTDIGITFYEGNEDFDVVLRSLETGNAVRGNVQLVTAGNRLLGEATADQNGVARFPRGLTRGSDSNALAAIMAHLDSGKGKDDFAFMTFNSERLDLSKLNIDGRVLVQGLDAFLTTDRGLYEPGQTVWLTALVRDAQGSAVEVPPKTFVRFETRDRAILQKVVDHSDWQLGGTLQKVNLPSELRSGPVRIVLAIGANEKDVIGETTIHIGPIKPDRVEVQFPGAPASWSAHADRGKMEASGPVVARYLFAANSDVLGAARNLRVEGIARISAAETPRPACYQDFVFGPYDEKPITLSSDPFVAVTNDAGAVNLDLNSVNIPSTTRPIAATIDVTVYDASGPLGSRSLVVPVNDSKGWIGLAKAPSLHTNPVTGKVTMDLTMVRLTPDNKPDAQHRVVASLSRERESYAWEVRDGSPQYTRSVALEKRFEQEFSTSQLEGADLGSAESRATDCVQPERIPNLFKDIDGGRYVLKVEDKDTGRVATMRIQIGSAQTDPDQLEPNIFVLSSDKQVYQANEAVELTAQTPFDGPILVGLARGDVKYWVGGRAENGIAKLHFTPPSEWAGKGFYALATVFRVNDSSGAAFGPDRAIGAKYIEISGQLNDFAASVAILSPRAPLETLAPGDDLKFRVCVSRAANADCATEKAAPGSEVTEDVYAVAYVVDEGLIGLTGHHSPLPDPKDHFFGRRRLDVRIMDNYSKMLLATGGDRPGRLALSNYTSDSIVASAALVKLQGGRTEYTFHNPGLVNGRLSVFVIAWSKSFATSVSSEVQAQSPIVADLGAPSYLLAGDQAIIPLRLVNFNFAQEGDFDIRVTSDGPSTKIALANNFTDKFSGNGSMLRTPLPLRGTKMLYLLIQPDPMSSGPLKVMVDIDPVGSDIALRGRRRTWQIDVRPPRLSSVAMLSFHLEGSPISLSDEVGKYVMTHYVESPPPLVTARFAENAQTLLNAASTTGSAMPARTLDALLIRAIAFFSNQELAKDPGSKPEGEKILGDIFSLQLIDGSFAAYRTIGTQSPTELNKSTTPEAMGTTLRRIAGVLETFVLAKAVGYAVPEQTVSDAHQFASSTLSSLSSDDRCSFEALLVTLALVDFGDIDQAKVEKITACPNEEIWSKAIVYAITTRFGSNDKGQVQLANFTDDVKQGGLKDLASSEQGRVKLAMMLNFFSRGDAPLATRELIAQALLPNKENPQPLSPTVTSWIPKAVSPTAGSALKLTNINLNGALSGTLHIGPNGELETATIPFPSLQNPPALVSLTGASTARAFVTVEGTLKDGKDEQLLPSGAIRRRIYSAKDGHEVNLKTDDLNLGDQLVIVLEADRSRLSSFLSTGSNGEPTNIEEPIVLADLLPSALTVLQEGLDRQEFKTPEWTKKLKPVGNLRSVATDAPDRWIALVIPDSRKTPPDVNSTGKGSASDQPKGRADENLDFRQAYLARVNLAGHFVWPALSLEGSTQFASTYRSEPAALKVSTSEVTAK
jgi:hypothetical protein